MKRTKMVSNPKNKKTVLEEKKKQLQQLFEEKGAKINSLIKRAMFENEKNVQSKEVRAALHYFLDEYWSDLARPTLMSLACEAVGGNAQTVTSITVPIMLIASGVDIHDDIIDKSKMKNERLTVFGKYGQDIALLTGDALMFKGFSLLQLALKNIPEERAKQVLRIFEKAFFDLGDAEALELPFKSRIDIDPNEYLRIINKKAADVEAYTHMSALISGGTKKEVNALQEYGRILGILAIMRDDLIDMIDKEELLHRLKNEVPPLPILYASLKPKAKSQISSILSKRRTTNRDIETIEKITKQNGGVVATEKYISELANQALASLRQLKHKRQELELLVEMIKTV
jgi:geranylgeranyl pyrophosphate synthase